MSDLSWIAVSVTIFLAPASDGHPDLNVAELGTYETEEACEMWKQDRYENPWGSVDPVSGKAVDRYMFDCIPRLQID